MEWKLFEGDVAPFTDDDFYRDREAAHHMEQEGHYDRLVRALEYMRIAKNDFCCNTFSDLGSGDGGLVQAATQLGFDAWGYDMAPNNVEYAQRVRGVDVKFVNFETDDVRYGDCSVLTEVLEHVSDPHSLVRDLPSKVLVASSPAWETPENHYEFHNWAWDLEGFAALMNQGGYQVVGHETVWQSQIVLAVRK